MRYKSTYDTPSYVFGLDQSSLSQMEKKIATYILKTVADTSLDIQAVQTGIFGRYEDFLPLETTIGNRGT